MITRTNYVHEKPILFSARMVKAILDGKKIMTRRIIKPQPSKEWHKGIGVTANRNNELCMSGNHGVIVSDLKCPYCKQIGDRLWVRENFILESIWDEVNPANSQSDVLYSASEYTEIEKMGFGKVRPSIHMPRWASRIDLEITGIAVEQLHDITEEDARAEGVGSVEEFKDLWKTINGPESWDSNPWLWVVKFEVANIRR